MAKKQFKIGEYAVGGIIAVEINGKVIQVKALDYYSKEEVGTGTVMSNEPNAERKLENYLHDLTSSYYANKVLDWIKSKVNLEYSY
jgi:hypothetical protein